AQCSGAPERCPVDIGNSLGHHAEPVIPRPQPRDLPVGSPLRWVTTGEILRVAQDDWFSAVIYAGCQSAESTARRHQAIPNVFIATPSHGRVYGPWLVGAS